jgi:phage host-nuclease inhibitor protein Gam
VASLNGTIDESLFAIAQEHLAKLADYVPGPVRKKGTRPKLLRAYKTDPVFSIFGLDSSEYLAATLAGGTVTSIHRKIGDIYEACVRSIFMQTLNLSATDVTYAAIIRSGNEEEQRSADAYLQFDKLREPMKTRVADYCTGEVAKLTQNPNINLVGVAMEVRHCYQTGDSKRTQADEAMARHLLLSGVLPIMPLFCNQSNPGIVSRYRSVWVIKEGMEAYDMIREMSGYDFFDFLKRNRRELRKPVIELLRNLSN